MSAALRVLHFGGYAAFRVCAALIRLVSLDCAFEIGRIGGLIAYAILFNRRAVALRNLRLALGEETAESELRAINRQHFQLLGANLLSGLKAATLTHEKIRGRITADATAERIQTGWIALISHIGNWELYGHLSEGFPTYRFGAVYQPVANPLIDRYIQRVRTKSGMTLFDRRSGLLSCVRFLREGGIVGVLIDQGAGYAGVWTPLFRRLTSSSTLAARLSIRTGLPVVPMAIYTSARARWKIVISDPLYPPTDDAEFLTAKINRLLEEHIRRAPADWLWAHNRWKPLRPHFLFARDQRRVYFAPDFDRSTLDPFRILIVASDSEEGVGATLPAIDAIKEGRPDASITVLTTHPADKLWENSHSIDRVIEWRTRESVARLASKIRQTAEFDVAIFFTTNWKTTLAVWNADIPLRVGRRSGANRWFCNQHPAEPTQPLDAARMNLHIARSVGANVNEPISQAE
jgi:KDO2-lipid IV(A) lauroyltransferase